MTGDERVYGMVAAGTATQPKRLVLSTHRDPDDMQASEEWIAASHTIDVER